MKTLEAQAPEILLAEVIELAAKQHTSVDQIVSLALTTQVSAWRTRERIASRELRDKKTFERLRRLITETVRTPFAGIGKPEPLKRELSGYWSRRITDEHRLVI